MSSRSFARTIAQLHDFNALGYDIHLCPNPLICGRRSQISVPWVRWLVLESDESPKAEQYAFLERHREGVLAAVDSGRRSLQMVLRIRDIRNPHCAHNVAELMQRLRRHERLIVELPRFERLVELVAARVRNEGLIPDMGVLK